MLVDYDSLVNELSSVLSECRLTAHRARVKALSTLLQGLLFYVRPVYRVWDEGLPC